MTSEHERQMQQANERASNARKQATALQSQLSLIQLVHVFFNSFLGPKVEKTS